MQTGKLNQFPMVAMGREFWSHLRTFIQHTMVDEGTINPADLDLIQLADTVEHAVAMIGARADCPETASWLGHVD